MFSTANVLHYTVLKICIQLQVWLQHDITLCVVLIAMLPRAPIMLVTHPIVQGSQYVSMNMLNHNDSY